MNKFLDLFSQYKGLRREVYVLFFGRIVTNLGDIMSDISSKRRGTVLGMTAEDGMQTVEAEVPMAEMSSYTIDLRSMTQGRGSFSCKFIRYEEAPQNVQQKVIEEAKALAEQE